MTDALILLAVALLIATAGTVMVVRGGIEHHNRKPRIGPVTFDIIMDLSAFRDAMKKIGEVFGASAKEMDAMRNAILAPEPEES